jgi:hypothetical protein
MFRLEQRAIARAARRQNGDAERDRLPRGGSRSRYAVFSPPPPIFAEVHRQRKNESNGVPECNTLGVRWARV